jgi:hypothetical protein
MEHTEAEASQALGDCVAWLDCAAPCAMCMTAIRFVQFVGCFGSDLRRCIVDFSIFVVQIAKIQE